MLNTIFKVQLYSIQWHLQSSLEYHQQQTRNPDNHKLFLLFLRWLHVLSTWRSSDCHPWQLQSS